MASFLGSDGDEGRQIFLCYQCDIAVRPATFSPLTCPHCHDGFLEECPDSPPSSPELHSSWDYMGGFGQLLDDISTFLARTDVTVNPFLLFQSQMQNLLSAQDDDFVSENGADFGHSHMVGDHLGPGLQQLIHHLTESESNRYGTPPAAMSVIEALPSITVSKEHLGTDSAQCAVCKDEFDLCVQVTQMPCKHLYHVGCILPWLAQHNSCPVCRFELPTDDPDYEQLRTRRIGIVEAARFTNMGSPVEAIGGDVVASSGGNEFFSNQQGASVQAEVGGELVTSRRMLSTACPSLLDIVASSSDEHAVNSSHGRVHESGSNELPEACDPSVYSVVLRLDGIGDSPESNTQAADPD